MKGNPVPLSKLKNVWKIGNNRKHGIEIISLTRTALNILQTLLYVHTKCGIRARPRIAFWQLINVQILGALRAQLFLVGKHLTYL